MKNANSKKKSANCFKRKNDIFFSKLSPDVCRCGRTDVACLVAVGQGISSSLPKIQRKFCNFLQKKWVNFLKIIFFTQID